MEIQWGTLVCITHEGKEITCIYNAFDYVKGILHDVCDVEGVDVFHFVAHFEWDKLGIPSFL